MNYIVSTLVFGAIVWWFAVGPVARPARAFRLSTARFAGWGAGVVGIALGMKGRWDFAIVLVSLSAWLLGFKLPKMFDPIGNARKSQIRTLACW